MPAATSTWRADPTLGVRFLLAGVGVVIAAQFWPVVPFAGAVALVAWGTVLTVADRPRWLLAATAMYAVVGIIAVSAQVDLAIRSPSALYGALAALDGAAATVLLYALMKQVGERIAGANS